jgi:hypothetical protein
VTLARLLWFLRIKWRHSSGHRSISYFESRKWVHKSEFFAGSDRLILVLPKSTLSAAAVDFGNTEIKIAAEYFDFMAHCSDTLCTIRSIVQTGGFNLENRRE